MRGASEPGGNSNDRDLKGSCNFAGKVAMPCPKPRREDWQAWVIISLASNLRAVWEVKEESTVGLSVLRMERNSSAALHLTHLCVIFRDKRKGQYIFTSFSFLGMRTHFLLIHSAQSHCLALGHTAPKAAISQWSELANDWLDHTGSTLESGWVGSITAPSRLTQSSHRAVT